MILFRGLLEEEEDSHGQLDIKVRYSSPFRYFEPARVVKPY